VGVAALGSCLRIAVAISFPIAGTMSPWQVHLSRSPKGRTLKILPDPQGAFELKGTITTGIGTPYALTVQILSSITGNGKFVQFTTGARCSEASISIHSVNGRKVACIPLGELNAGRHRAKLPAVGPDQWDTTLVLK